MNIVAIDTSTKFLCAGIAIDNRIVASYRGEALRRLSKDLVVIIERLLKKAGLELPDINAYAVGMGPGSFTGLRVGFATIKGLNFERNAPVAGIPSLDSIAYNAACCKSAFVCPVIDAKRGLVYTCLYKRTPGGLARVSPYMLIPLEQLFTRIRGTTCFLGDGLVLYREQIRRALPAQACFAKEESWYPKSDTLLSLARSALAKNIPAVSKKGLFPMYLYKSDCQVRGK